MNTLVILAQAVEAAPPADSYFDQLTSWNEQLNGLPGGTLTAIFVGVLCVILRWLRFFPNDQVPRWTIILGIGIFFCLSNPRPVGLPMQIYIGKAFVIGFIISAVVTFAVSRFGSKLPIIGQYLTDEPPTKLKDQPPPSP